jgi:hypothetical protein
MMESVFEHIVKSYNSLWNCKVHGDSIEVITPSSTTNDMFVSVFVTRKEGEYIVTDGGWISDGYYDVVIPENTPCFDRVFSHYYNFYRIKDTEGKGKRFYYKKTSDVNLVPNLVYDLSGFISAVVSSSLITFTDEKETDNILRFRRQANNFLAAITDKKEIKFNAPFDDNFKVIKFSAIITRGNRLNLINYVTGSNESYFAGSLGRANMNFEIIESSPPASFINKKIAIINDCAPGYKLERMRHYIDLMNTRSNLVSVNWSNREELEKHMCFAG